MRDLLSRPSREVLARFARSRLLLAFDFDGTLAPIVADPDRAAMRPSTRALLQAAARVYPTIVISGRARADVRRRLDGVDVRETIGNHGIEPSHAAAPLRQVVRGWLPLLRSRLAPYRGVTVEDKTFSVAIHYRGSRERKRASAAILEVIRALGPVRVVGGKLIMNVIPEGAPHKGVALERERARLGCDTALYVGDDETDEDVFLLDQPGRLLTVRVGSRRASAARYFLRDQVAIDRLLRLLIELHPVPASARLAAR